MIFPSTYRFIHSTFELPLGKNVHIITPVICAIASACFAPFYMHPFIAHTIGILTGHFLYKIFSSDTDTSHLLKSLDFFQKHLYIIYLVTIIATLALMHISIYLGVISSFFAATLAGYVYDEREKLMAQNLTLTYQPIVY